MATLKYKRVILKLSGEAFSGAAKFGIDNDTLVAIAKQIRRVHALGVNIGIVCGGGNFWRGSTAAEMGIDRVTADHAGMLATVINALALQDVLEQQGVTVRTQSELTEALTTACKAQDDGVTTFIEVILNQELGEPFRRDAMKTPVVVAGIDRADMRPQQPL